MNEVHVGKALRQFGRHGSKQLEDLTRQLGHAPPLKKARIAPSLITRSEAELFSISVPRFALRFYLPRNAGFINCRRLADFCGFSGLHLPAAWGNRYSSTPRKRYPETIDAAPHTIPLKDLLSSAEQSCIADCLIAPPPWLTDRKARLPLFIPPGTLFTKRPDLHMLSVDLRKDYGEADESDPKAPTKLSPYLKHISLGGGLCGQSVCFIATSLLNGSASGVYGLAEISALAHGSEYAEFPISGLHLDHITSYLKAVSLYSLQQFPTPPIAAQDQSTISTTNSLTLTFHKELKAALDAYLLSGMPVIFPTDLAILAGVGGSATGDLDEVSIYAGNGWKVKESIDPTAIHRHTIILVGCAESTDTEEPRYVFHDPTAGPFMLANLRQLCTIGSYKDENKTEREDGLILPVTPKAVRVPLLAWRKIERQPNPQFGLIKKAQYYRRHSQGWPTQDREWFGAFILSKVSGLANMKCVRGLTEGEITDRVYIRGKMCEAAKIIAPNVVRGSDHWVWVESGKGSIWIWDAEVDFETEEHVDSNDLFICHVSKSGISGRWWK